MTFDIEADIRVARTMPGRVYSDPELFRAQRDRVFARTWHYPAHDDVVKVPGQVYPFTLLPGALDEPLVLTCDTADRIHCLSNVCTHRGTLVVEGPGHEQQLRCRYHGRRFGWSTPRRPSGKPSIGYPSDCAGRLASAARLCGASLMHHSGGTN